MNASENPQLWTQVVASAGLSVPSEQQEPFQALAGDIQSLMGTLRGAGLGEAPPDFAFRAQ